MALLIELSPKLLVIHEKGSLEKEVTLDTGALYRQFSKLHMRFTVFAALGGNIGNEIERVMQKNGCVVEKITIKDDSKIDSLIIENGKKTYAVSNKQKLTFDDINNIRNRYISSLYNEDIVVLPISDMTKELAPEFITRVREYYKKSIVYGDGVGEFLKYEPDIAILTKDDVTSICPFKIESEYELIKFSFSLVEERKTRMIVVCENKMLFYKEGICYMVEGFEAEISKTLFGTTIALQNNFDKEELVQFIAATNKYDSFNNLGQIREDMKNIRVSVHRQ